MSTLSYTFLLRISLCDKKQLCIALSTKSEYIDCATIMHETVWLKRFFQYLYITTGVNEAILVYYYSVTALAYDNDPKYIIPPKTLTYSVNTFEMSLP